MEDLEESKLVQSNTVKQVIAVMSLYNATIKDSFSANLGYLLAKKTNEKVLLVDFECPFPTLDHYFNTDKYIYLNELYSAKRLTGLSGILSGIKKGVFNAQTFPEYVKEVYGHKNLYLLTGLYDIDLFEDFEMQDVDDIIAAARQNFDTVIISLNSFIYNVFTYLSIMRSDRVIMISEPTITNGRANINLIKQFETVQKVPRQRFSVLLWGNQMDVEMRRRLYDGFEVIGAMPANPHYIDALLHKKLLLTYPNTKKDLNAYLAVLQYFGYTSKEPFFQRLMQSFKQPEEAEDE